MDFERTEVSKLELRSVFDLNFYEVNNLQNSQITQKQEDLFYFWKNSWEKSFTELGVKEKTELFSDDFLAKRVLSFFHKGEPIGCIFLEKYNLTSSIHRSSKYLKNFPEEAISFLRKKDFKTIYAISNLTIQSEWRKKFTDISVSQLLTSIGTWLACQERGDAIVSCVRNDRSVNKLFQNHNSQKILTSFRFNCAVDFIYIDLKQAQIFPDEHIMKAAMYFLTGNHIETHEASA